MTVAGLVKAKRREGVGIWFCKKHDRKESFRMFHHLTAPE
jgi:hypothetical protein